MNLHITKYPHRFEKYKRLITGGITSLTGSIPRNIEDDYSTPSKGLIWLTDHRIRDSQNLGLYGLYVDGNLYFCIYLLSEFGFCWKADLEPEDPNLWINKNSDYINDSFAKFRDSKLLQDSKKLLRKRLKYTEIVIY